MTWKDNPLTSFANARPVIFFITATYLWTWAFWISTQTLIAGPQGLTTALNIIGSFGPALAGILTLRLWAGVRDAGAMKRAGFLVGAALALAAILVFRFNLAGATPEQLEIPADSPAYVYVLLGAVVAISGFVFASIQSRDPHLRDWFAGLVPNRRTLALAIPILLILPVLLISSNAVADMLGMSYDQPRYLREPMSLWLSFMFVKMFTVAILTGGNEEHGWRAVLLPQLQKTMSPLFASLIIIFAWELWHLPFIFGSFYGYEEPWIALGFRFANMIFFAFLLTAIYNRSRGSIFLCILFHACMNSQIGLFAGSRMANIIGIILVIALILVYRMWRRNSGYVPEPQQ